MTWIPVSERLPKHCGMVRVKFKDGRKGQAWLDYSKQWEATWGNYASEITAWCELEPPKEAK